jgi:endonuclease/exonuclease/phosphatase family metal-dependent hydrolase
MIKRKQILGAALVMAIAGCQTQRNYRTAEGPRYAGEAPPHLIAGAQGDTLKIVSFNIEFALQVDSALKVLRTDPDLAHADIILLQEMDNPGTRYVARELGMHYVYYPATRHLRHDRDFGNAVLSRWPIVGDRKIVLPHVARVYKTMRTATAASIAIGRDTLRVYSAHLGTSVNIDTEQRREQLETILADAASHKRVVLGGDMNDPRIGRVAVAAGYGWPTENGPPTATVGRLDHIFVKGLSIPQENAAGTVLETRNASDHRPIWIRAVLR